MHFDPALFAKVGRSITRQGSLDKEARIRTAIGRAYYALFLAIRTAIRNREGKATHGRGDRIDHGKLTNFLYAANDPELKGLAGILNDLYEVRRQADYVLEPVGNWDGYFTKIRDTERFLKQVEATIRKLPNIDFTEMVGKI